ncbi:cyclic nucleotide-binding/CBS domain-containing protein [Micromonospora sp. LOL_024]|uniref:CBS domain-containing protein n=1 Tax=Micromonospora sp. LOL_024 TaxID=3345412 RepID=UPI003A890E00
MQVREAMSSEILVVGPEHTLRQAARMMSERGIGSAVVIDPDSEGIGIMTERDVLNAIGAGLDCDVERTGAHLTSDVVYAGPQWTIEEAAAAMARGGFRHLVVLDGREVAGVISVRDIMRVWAADRMVGTG